MKGLGFRVVVKNVVPSWVPNIIWRLLFRVPQKGTPNFDNHPKVGLLGSPCVIISRVISLLIIRVISI